MLADPLYIQLPNEQVQLSKQLLNLSHSGSSLPKENVADELRVCGEGESKPFSLSLEEFVYRALLVGLTRKEGPARVHSISLT